MKERQSVDFTGKCQEIRLQHTMRFCCKGVDLFKEIFARWTLCERAQCVAASRPKSKTGRASVRHCALGSRLHALVLLSTACVSQKLWGCLKTRCALVFYVSIPSSSRSNWRAGCHRGRAITETSLPRHRHLAGGKDFRRWSLHIAV
jgi:hypothetical protein